MYQNKRNSAEWMHYQYEKIPHNCEKKGDNDDLYAMYPGTKFSKIFSRAFRGFFICSHKNVRAIRLFRSHANIEYERSRQLRLFCYMIHPYSYFIVLVEMIMILSTLNFMCVTLWLVSFRIEVIPDEYKIVLERLVLTDEIISFAFIVINFLTGQVRHVTRRVELRFWNVVKLYLRGYFLFDFIGMAGMAIPHIHYRFIAESLAAMPGHIRFPVFLSNACKMARLVPQIRHTTVVLRISHEKSVYILATVGLACYFHFAACSVFFIAYQFNNGNENAWLAKEELLISNEVSTMYRASIGRCIYDTMGMCLQYRPQTSEDQVPTMVLSWTGLILFLSVVGKIMQLTRARNSSVSQYDAIITEVKQYMASRKLPYRLQSRVLEFYYFRFQGTFFNENMIVKNLSRQLRQDYMYYHCRRLVEKVAFFGDLPAHVLMRIVAVMQTEFYLHGETVIQLDTIGSSMFFIKTGTVAVYSAFGQEVCHLEDGNHFGEIALVLSHFRRVAQVVTIENCELYRLERKEFNVVMAPYPELLDMIRITAMRRLEKMIVLEASHNDTLGENAARSTIGGMLRNSSW